MSVSRMPLPLIRSVPRYVMVAAGAIVILGSISTYMLLNPGGLAAAVPTAKVEWGAIYPYISVSGTIGNHQGVDISSSNGGQIVNWLVQEGSIVKAGQPLAYFSDYAINEQIYLDMRTKLTTVEQVERDASLMQQSEELQSATPEAIAQDQAAVSQADQQWVSAKQMATDAKTNFDLAQKVQPDQLIAAKTDADKALTAVTVDDALFRQAQAKLTADKAVEATDSTVQMDKIALQVVKQQLASAQDVSSATVGQEQSQSASDLQSAKDALDQAKSQVQIDQAVFSEAETKLASDDQPQASAATVQQDQNSISELQAELTAAQSKLTTDQQPQSSSSVLQQDTNNANILQGQISAAQAKLTTDQTPQSSAATLQQDQASISLLGQELTGAKSQLSVDTTNNASTSVLQNDQNNMNDLQQELTDAQAKLTLDQTPQASSAQIQADQSSISVLQAQLAAATTQLNVDKAQTASAALLQQDQASITVLQQQLSNAQSQYNTDKSQTASASTLGQDQRSIAVLQQQLTASQNQLSVDKTSPAPAYVIQQDGAAIAVAQQQLLAAETVEADNQALYLDAQSGAPSASLAAVQTALAQASGTVEVDQALVAQANTKMLADKASAQPQAVLEQDQAAISVAQKQLQSATTLNADAKQANKLAQTASPVQVANARLNMDQAIGSTQVDQASWNAANVKLKVDESPVSKRDQLQLDQGTLGQRQAVIQARLDLLNAQNSVTRSELQAPVDGVVVSVDFPTGARLSPDQPALTILPTKETERVVAMVDASQIDQVKKGQKVTINSPDFSGSGIGVVRFVSPLPVASQQGGAFQYPVYIDVLHLPSGSVTGMIVNTRILTPPLIHVVTVPASAVMTQNGTLGVYVRDAAMKFSFKKINIGASDDAHVQITEVPAGTVVALKQP